MSSPIFGYAQSEAGPATGAARVDVGVLADKPVGAGLTGEGCGFDGPAPAVAPPRDESLSLLGRWTIWMGLDGVR